MRRYKRGKYSQNVDILVGAKINPKDTPETRNMLQNSSENGRLLRYCFGKKYYMRTAPLSYLIISTCRLKIENTFAKRWLLPFRAYTAYGALLALVLSRPNRNARRARQTDGSSGKTGDMWCSLAK